MTIRPKLHFTFSKNSHCAVVWNVKRMKPHKSKICPTETTAIKKVQKSFSRQKSNQYLLKGIHNDETKLL